jgi:hypothetical protein
MDRVTTVENGGTMEVENTDGMTVEELQKRVDEATTTAEVWAAELQEAKTREASALRNRALELRNEAADLEGRANQLDPKGAEINYDPPEPEPVRMARENGGLVPKPRKKAVAKRAPRSPRVKLKTKGPTQSEVVAALRKHRTPTTARIIAAKNGWDPEVTKRRMNAAARSGQVTNQGSRKAPQWAIA